MMTVCSGKIWLMDPVCEGSAEIFHTFIFSKKMERTGGVRVEGIVGCYVTSWQSKSADLVVSVGVAMKW
jgi:hypothetical protein